MSILCSYLTKVKDLLEWKFKVLLLLQFEIPAQKKQIDVESILKAEEKSPELSKLSIFAQLGSASVCSIRWCARAGIAETI